MALAAAQLGVLGSVLGPIKTFSDTWSAVASAFGTRISKTVVSTIKGTGWTKLRQSVVVQKIVNMQASFLDQFLRSVPTAYNIPSKYRADTEFALTSVKFSGGQQWNKWDLAFDINKGGSARYICVLGHRDPNTGNTDWVIANMKASFKLAPDVFVWRRSASYAGGIFSSTTDSLEKRPRSLTAEDIRGMLHLLAGAALGPLGAELGANLNVPVPKFLA